MKPKTIFILHILSIGRDYTQLFRCLGREREIYIFRITKQGVEIRF